MASTVAPPQPGGKALASLLGAAAKKNSSVNLLSRPRTAGVSRPITVASIAGAAPKPSSIRTDLNLIREPIQMNPIKQSSIAHEVSADLDDWIKHSITEIVRNVGEAPLLVHVYSDGIEPDLRSNPGRLRVVTEKAVAEEWPLIRGRWERGGNCKAPNGIILVEELNAANREEFTDLKEEDNSNSDMEQLQCSGTQIWGLLIQGRGKGGGACYILKTCRVPSSLGFCTHFCLARVDCLAESAELQLKKLWLQHRVSAP